MRILILHICLCAFFVLQVYGQSNTILAKYFDAVNKIKTVKYSSEVKMVFTDGVVWNLKGVNALAKDTANKVMGFKFWGKRLDVVDDGLYDGINFYEINHETKSYKVERNAGQGILGVPGGQNVVKDIIVIDTAGGIISSTYEHDVPMIRVDYPDDPEFGITQRKKIIYLDSKTFLPLKVTSTLQAHGKNEEITAIIKDIEVNRYTFSTVIDGIDFISFYKDKTGEGRKRKELLGTVAPEFVLQSFDSVTISLLDYRGKIILIDFWETWCSPCIQTMSKVQKLYEQYKSKGLIVLGIHGNRKDLDVAEKIIREKKISYPNLIADEKIMKDYDVLGVPKYILIDTDGKIIFSNEGYDTALEELLSKTFSN